MQELPDLSHLTEEERNIIMAVMDRQKEEEEKEEAMLKKGTLLSQELYDGVCRNALNQEITFLTESALDLFIPQTGLVARTALTQVQHLALGLVEPCEIPTGPVLELVQVPVDAILSFRCVSHTIQLDVICKCAEGAPDPFVSVINEDIE
ncbi:hypothetical protein DUI87_10918 [Hirundo rustica rustica]|uniref:RabBD domain-containing protein n=1 Tax=Hirundo rustica rustica TaxID=333673 RepID=A0A3M0KJX5_HIRRU|nr:hypothetical protein DUI87_10918 [Hirundo rustica rustica]